MAKKGKIKFINEPQQVKGFEKLRQSIKVKVGDELIPVYGNEGDFDQYGTGADVWIRKNGKNWELCSEGDEDISEKPAQQKWQGGNNYTAPAPKPELTLEQLRKRGSERVTLFMSLVQEVREELQLLGMEGVPDNVILATTSHVFNATV